MSNQTKASNLVFRAADFTALEHAHFIKGLLRPFKDKGELNDWASRCELLRNQLIAMSGRLMDQSRTLPIALLPASLTQQKTAAGTTFLRWRSSDRTEMGDSLLARLMRAETTPAFLIAELAELEVQRIVVNMQISLTHSIARQARECARRAALLEQICSRRNPIPRPPHH